MELIFFPGTGVVPCFVLRMRTMLIARWHFSCCWAALHRAKAFPAPGAALPARGREVPQQPGGDRPRTDPKGWPTARNVLLCNTTGGAGTAQGQAGHQAAGGGQLYCTALALYSLLFGSLPFPSYWTVFISNHKFLPFSPTPILSPIPPCVGGCVVLSCPPG